MTGRYRRDFDENKRILLLERYDEIWEKVENIIKKRFDSEHVYNEKYLKAKIKCYNGKIKTNFHNNTIRKEGSKFIGLSEILIGSVFKTGKNYYLQVFFLLFKKKRCLSILLTI